MEQLPGVSGEGMTRTDMDCHQCGKSFIAQLDFSIDGNHILECPHCGHEHCRVIKGGVVTGERWSSRADRIDVDKRNVWKSGVIQAKTTTASTFIRDLWLNRSDINL